MDEDESLFAELAAHTRRLLSEHGPMTEDDLADALLGSGLVDEDEVDDALGDVLDDYLSLAMPLIDDRWAFLPALLDGRIFTHEVGAREIEHDLLDILPDLAPVAIFAEDDDEYGDGYPFSVPGEPQCTVVLPGLDGDLLAERGIPDDVVPDAGGLLLASGTLGDLGVGAGDLVGVRVTPAGLTFERIAAETTERSIPDGLGSALLDALSSAAADDVDADSPQPEPLDVVVWSACAADPGLFVDPWPPLGRLVEELGLTLDEEWLAPPGFDLARWRAHQRLAAIARRHELDSEEAFVVLAGITLFEQVALVYEAARGLENGDPSFGSEMLDAITAAVDAPRLAAAAPGRMSVRDTLAGLVEPAVAAALLAEIGPADEITAAALLLFTQALESAVPRPARVALRWQRGKAHEFLGDLTAAETAFRAAESLDPTWGPVLVELARLASERGDAERGLTLLRRAGAPDDDDLMMMLQRFQPAPRRALGRNAPCWCGSGRKYKQCHLHNERLPLEERAAWLYQKAGMALTDHHRLEVIEAAVERAQFDDSSTAIHTALNDPLVADAVLFEGGAFADFLDRRGSLLPADELLLGRQWTLGSRSVFEVEAVRRGEGLRVRDLRTGDVHDIRERTASRQLGVGTLICTRVVNVGDTMQIFGGIEPVTIGERDELLALLDADPSPAELVAFLTRRFAPIRLQNTESEPMALCEALVHIADPDGFAQALTAELGAPEHHDAEADGTAWRWHETVVTKGMPRIRATLTLTGHELTVEANSTTRQDRALETVRRLAPSATVITDRRRPVRDANDITALHSEFSPDDDADVLDPSDPEVAAAIAEVVRQFEQTWLDESIPALGGRTPRECAADPTRRPDVIALLDSFQTGPGSMDVDRLRAALGLT